MNYLLDTHAFLWAIFDSKKLSKIASEIILDTQNLIHISLISFWEISLKYNLGKIALKNILPDDLPFYTEKSGFEIIIPTTIDMATFYQLPREKHKDPFDRMIIWQCIQNNFNLISKDRNFKSYKNLGLKVTW